MTAVIGSGLPDTAAQRPLEGIGIVITRPAHQAIPLAELIAQAGGRPILFPVLEILDVENVQALDALIDRLDSFDIAIFISPNAVNKAMNLIRARRSLPAQLTVAAIGRGSRKELLRFGVNNVVTPEGKFDSEHLVQSPLFEHIAGKRIVIFRGDGGREFLGDELARRGAEIEYAECYRRSKPNVDAGPLLYHWARNELHAITVTSAESLHNLFDLVGKLGQQWLKKTPLFVTHPRIAEVAQALGATKITVTDSGDEPLLDALIAWRGTTPSE